MGLYDRTLIVKYNRMFFCEVCWCCCGGFAVHDW